MSHKNNIDVGKQLIILFFFQKIGNIGFIKSVLALLFLA